MKKSLTFVFMLFVTFVYAQEKIPGVIKGKDTIIRICAPSRANVAGGPLLIAEYGQKKYQYKNETGGFPQNLFSVNNIESVSILKDKEDIEKFGDDGKNGVILIKIKNDKIPEFKKELKAYKKSLKQNSQPN